MSNQTAAQVHLSCDLIRCVSFAVQAYNIKCYGEDSVWVRNMLLDCSNPVKQACYTRASGEKGCTTLENCQRPDWTCCYTDGCNI
ncbi:uncharacterized protein wu:fj16a03 [Epinephelus moara]|uniref:uncharacterized protein wu:fj16a03 n=1 Tax=Epinephelus moara TaxID=300413 RepID=UPI00214DF2E8|nr:uncharacterized protein wu:fj16a03 [Epinephelus moara]